jgi:hypothetical protein
MEPTAIFHPKTTTSYKDDINFANIITDRYSTSQNLFETKSRLESGPSRAEPRAQGAVKFFKID